MGNYRYFTDEEIALIRARYPSEGGVKLGEELGRGRKEISHKAKALGLSCVKVKSANPVKKKKSKKFPKVSPTGFDAVQLVEACIKELEKTTKPLTSLELSERIGRYPRHIGLTLSRANDKRIAGVVKKNRTRVWSLTPEYRALLLSKASEIAETVNDIEHDKWFSALQSEVVARKMVLHQIRGRV